MSHADGRARIGPFARLLMVSTVLLCGHAAAEGLRAHEVVYRTAFKGLNAGDLRLTLRREPQTDTWSYETRAYPSLLARFVISPNSIERSIFSVGASGVEPQRYSLNDGSSAKDKGYELHYDRARGRVTGLAEGKPIDVALEPGLQDANSIRVALMVDLLAGREPHEYAMLDGREIKHFVYTRVGNARITTALGPLDTVLVRSDRKDADGRSRSWQFWYAPSLGFLPVRIEQRDGGQTRLSFEVRSFKWLEDAPAPKPGGH